MGEDLSLAHHLGKRMQKLLRFVQEATFLSLKEGWKCKMFWSMSMKMCICLRDCCSIFLALYFSTFQQLLGLGCLD